jgi:hypothetical protein
MKQLLLMTLPIILMALTTLGCDSDKRDRVSTNLQIELTDAPFPFESVAQANIIISEIAVVGDDGITPIDSQTRVYDLVQLQHGQTAILTSLALLPGEYKEFRLKVDSATLTLTDGRSFALKIPSGSSSGLKIKLDTPLQIDTGL